MIKDKNLIIYQFSQMKLRDIFPRKRWLKKRDPPLAAAAVGLSAKPPSLLRDDEWGLLREVIRRNVPK